MDANLPDVLAHDKSYCFFGFFKISFPFFNYVLSIYVNLRNSLVSIHKVGLEFELIKESRKHYQLLFMCFAFFTNHDCFKYLVFTFVEFQYKAIDEKVCHSVF